MDVAVIGLPDEVTGERACAVLSINKEAAPITIEEMQKYLDDAGLRRNAIPEQLEIIELIPRNPSGKITKNVLKEEFKNSAFLH